jgi:ADP-ribose pyrophosphatase YjhB (NUDIX family)
MSKQLGEFAWEYYCELRKELVSLQRIRSQIFGFKITFVSAVIGLLIANIKNIPPITLTIPAISAIFFDLLIHSYSFSIKRTGFYCKTHLEPLIRDEVEFPSERPLWEQFAFSPAAGRNVSLLGSLGITFVALVPAIYGLFKVSDLFVSIPVLIVLLVLFYYDYRTLYNTNVFYSSKHQYQTYINPKPCVAVIISQEDKILLARRGVEPLKGKWDIVGGFIEVDESSEDAVIRETKEETGLEVTIKEYLGSVADVYGDTHVATLNYCYLVEVKGGEPVAKSDVAELKWFAKDEIPEDMAFAHQEQAINWYKEYFDA